MEEELNGPKEKTVTAEDNGAKRLIILAAKINSMFLDLQIAVAKEPRVSTASISVNPTLTSRLAEGSLEVKVDYATLGFYLEGELRRPTDRNRRALGFQVLIHSLTLGWRVEAEIGWSGIEIGWDQFEEQLLEANSLSMLERDFPPLVETMAARFKQVLHERLT